MFGYYGRILTIDLSSKTAVIESLSDDYLSGCLGGKGLATLKAVVSELDMPKPDSKARN